MVRVGLGIYGLRPAPGMAPDVELRPAMRVVSRVTHLQRLPAGARPSYGRRRRLAEESTVATVPIGYADGVPRRLVDGAGTVLIRGRRHPFAGSVTMDQIVIDVGDDPVELGDHVVLLGAQDGDEITADEWAERLGTISYEVVCGFGPRVPRRYRS
jgi:alanine racemase